MNKKTGIKSQDRGVIPVFIYLSIFISETFEEFSHLVSYMADTAWTNLSTFFYLRCS